MVHSSAYEKAFHFQKGMLNLNEKKKMERRKKGRFFSS